MNRSTPGFPVHHQLSEFTQTHIHRVSDAIQPSPPLSSPSPPTPNPCQHQSLFQWVNSSDEVAKVLEFQLEHHSLLKLIFLSGKKNRIICKETKQGMFCKLKIIPSDVVVLDPHFSRPTNRSKYLACQEPVTAASNNGSRVEHVWNSGDLLWRFLLLPYSVQTINGSLQQQTWKGSGNWGHRPLRHKGLDSHQISKQDKQKCRLRERR